MKSDKKSYTVSDLSRMDKELRALRDTEVHLKDLIEGVDYTGEDAPKFVKMTIDGRVLSVPRETVTHTLGAYQHAVQVERAYLEKKFEEIGISTETKDYEAD